MRTSPWASKAFQRGLSHHLSPERVARALLTTYKGLVASWAMPIRGNSVADVPACSPDPCRWTSASCRSNFCIRTSNPLVRGRFNRLVRRGEHHGRHHRPNRSARRADRIGTGHPHTVRSPGARRPGRTSSTDFIARARSSGAHRPGRATGTDISACVARTRCDNTEDGSAYRTGLISSRG
jgi:hypothetical protein